MRKTFQYRIRMGKKTTKICSRWLDMCKDLYNLMLEERIKLYKGNKASISCYDQINELPKFKVENPDYANVNSQTLQEVVQRLDKAYESFFRRVKTKQGKAGFPRFKSANRYDSFTLTQSGWKLENDNLIISKIGRLKLFLNRPIEGDIRTVTIKRNPTGKWFASFSCDNVPEHKLEKKDNSIGLDVGIKSFVVDSAGKIINNPKYMENSFNKLKTRQQKLSKQEKGTDKRRRARLLVARIYEKINNQRKDFLHKTANYYIRNYQNIYVEDLSILDMVKTSWLAKSILSASWASFFNLLSYKAEEAGREMIKVNPRYTSQICSSCGEIVKKDLSVRFHECSCGLKIDRDLNAARNILRIGLDTLAANPA